MTDHMRRSFSFVVLALEREADRLHLESRLISTVSLCQDCGDSASWLGNTSPLAKIRESGLWQIQELYKERFSPVELDTFIGPYRMMRCPQLRYHFLC